MSESSTIAQQPWFSVVWKVLAFVVVVSFFLTLFFIGLIRYYNAQEVKALVDGAEAKGKSYSLTIHNSLTGSYSFSIE